VLGAHAKRPNACILPMDVLLSALAFTAALAFEGPEVAGNEESRGIGLLLPGLVAALSAPLLLERLGDEGVAGWHGVAQLAGALPLAVVASTLALATALVLTGAGVRPVFPLAVGAAQLVLLGLLRVVVHAATRLHRRTQRNYRNVLIVGSGRRARRALHVLQRHRTGGLRVIGFVDQGDAPHDARIPADRVFKLVELPDILRQHAIDEVIVACPRSMLGDIGSVVAASAAAGVPMTLLSDLFGDYLPPPRVTRLGTLPALSFEPVHHSPTLLAAKRAIDLVVGSVGLGLSLPVIAVAALAIAVSGSGPVFARKACCGLYGRRFEMLSLRSVCAGAGGRARFSAWLARFLRRWRIDALPRFWNVVAGDLSLVGPRPPVPIEAAEYAGFDRRRLSMRPGLASPPEVPSLRPGGAGERMRIDLDYIDTWSPANDARILLGAVWSALRATEA
jgi:lipopolysaccharide/colanic/teichoic acid biosynthesis glycosyltransferase